MIKALPQYSTIGLIQEDQIAGVSDHHPFRAKPDGVGGPIYGCVSGGSIGSSGGTNKCEIAIGGELELKRQASRGWPSTRFVETGRE